MARELGERGLRGRLAGEGDNRGGGLFTREGVMC